MTEKGKKKQVETQLDSIELIKELLSPKVIEEERMWQEITVAIEDVTEMHTKEAEELLVRLLDLQGPILLAPGSDIPGILSPEDMLRFAAIQALSEWKGRKYLKNFTKIYHTTPSPTLRNIAKVYIEKMGGKVMERDDEDIQ